jgi:hypothetical protein
MGSLRTRSLFAAALCSGVAMVGVAVYGLVGVDAELQRSALAAQQTSEPGHAIRVIDRGDGGDCGSPALQPSRERQRI